MDWVLDEYVSERLRWLVASESTWIVERPLCAVPSVAVMETWFAPELVAVGVANSLASFKPLN